MSLSTLFIIGACVAFALALFGVGLGKVDLVVAGLLLLALGHLPFGAIR